MQDDNSQQRASEYLRVAHRFRLGQLTTEQPHPDTRDLSRWAQNDPARAVSMLKRVDRSALRSLETYASAIDRLGVRVARTLDRGKRVFLVGCGATGRLALSLEYLWRQQHGADDRVVAFMAGGDVALVHALEGFEDHPAYGALHLDEIGFTDGDLLIASTEGGETPYVIGATERAARISPSNRPFFLYCNADAVLTPHVKRFRRVRDNPNIEKICLCVGPMALTGSTRMQASTVLQLAVGLALLHPGESAAERIAEFRGRVERADLSFLADFVKRESEIYAAGDHVVYRVRDYAITVMTDTTERAPTFSLIPFDRLNGRPMPRSLCYVSLPDAESAEDAWTRLLNRTPRPLDWPEVDPRTTRDYLLDFDFSAGILETRRRRIPGNAHHAFRIQGAPGAIELRLNGEEHDLPVDGMPELFRHLLLKQVLNIHSTLVMGRLGRYERNLMTWVSPTNNKLVDRATRYVQHLLSHAGRVAIGYEEIVRRLFTEMDETPPGESVVLRTYRALREAGPGRSPTSGLHR